MLYGFGKDGFLVTQWFLEEKEGGWILENKFSQEFTYKA